MPVMWCKECGALMGMQPPFHEWGTVHGLCAACLKKMAEYLPPDLKEKVEKPPTPPPAVDKGPGG